MMAFDPERTEKLIGAIRDSVMLLQELAGLPGDEFYCDRHKQGSAKYNFIAAIEACIDLANHLISRNGWRAPEDYADTFQVLAESGVLEPGFAQELKKMARFRNRLVHVYWDVDVGELHHILTTRLGDFDRFIRTVLQDFESSNGTTVSR